MLNYLLDIVCNPPPPPKKKKKKKALSKAHISELPHK